MSKSQIKDEGTGLPLRVLPNRDLWRPNYGETVPPQDNVRPPSPQEKRTLQEKVDEVTKGSALQCPWCDLIYEGKVSLQNHIAKDHRSMVMGDDEAEQEAARATSVRAKKAAAKK